jgi:hypothetical protein
MAKHTPGALIVEECYDGGRTVAQMRSPNKLVCINSLGDVDPPGYKATDANARRLVALWNLCDPLNTEELESTLALDSPRDRMARLMRLACEAMLRAPLIEGMTDV